jgi:hypothetical protein
VILAARRLRAGPTVTGMGGGRELWPQEPRALSEEGEVCLWSLSLADPALIQQPCRLGLGGARGPRQAAPPPSPSGRNERQMAGIELGAAAAARTESRLPAAPTPLPLGPARITPSAAPPPPGWGERGWSHLPSSPQPCPPPPGHGCDGNRGSCQLRLGV